MRNDYTKDFVDAINKAFDFLGLDTITEEDIKDYTDRCNEAICKCRQKVNECKGKVTDVVNEKKECIKEYVDGKLSACTMYRDKVEDGLWILEVVAPGYDEDMVRVTVNPIEKTITIKNDYDGELEWYMNHIDVSVAIPDGVNMDTLLKTIEDGVITISASISDTPKYGNSYEL